MTVRPEFHFTAPSGWINDPHGITFRDGVYETFYQYVPDSIVWGPNCHWGHATGPDLLTLTPGPVALAPGDEDDGIWTGALVRNSGVDRIFYTSVTLPHMAMGRIRVARPLDPEWTTWEKGVVVAEAPAGVDAFRDPFVLAEPDGSWRMFVGAALADGNAAALAFRSHDLDSWQYEGIALQRSSREAHPVWMGALWECPQIVSLGDRHVMISSVWEADVLHYAGFALGSYSEGRFDADGWGRLTYGPSYYAPSYFRDGSDRACVIFWMRGVEDAAERWAGAHSVPYLLDLDGELPLLTPHPDVAGYRADASAAGDIAGLAADIEWMPGRALMIDSGGAEVARLSTDGGELCLHTGGESWSMPYAGGPVRVIVDGPVLEVSGRSGLIGAAVAPQGESLRVHSDSPVNVWRLAR